MKLASIEAIAEIHPHPNADTLDIAKVLGWECVVKRGQFTKGEKAVFVPIDTILPDAPWSAFLKKGDKPIRLVTVKLRGVHSQGLLLKLDALPEHARGWQIGADVGGVLGVRKHEKEIPACLSGQVKSAFPLYLAPKTDEDNGLSNPELVAEVLRNPCMATVKLDGSSCTIIIENGEICHVCSRNMSLIDDGKNAFWRAAKKGKYNGFTGIIQGELMGPGIQGNQLKLTEPTLYVFQVSRRGGGWLDFNSMSMDCYALGFNTVWGLGSTPPTNDIDSWKLLADSVTLPDGSPAEGIVVRPVSQVKHGMGRPIGFKLINRNYKDT